jgi:hypothetical protein
MGKRELPKHTWQPILPYSMDAIIALLIKQVLKKIAGP